MIHTIQKYILFKSINLNESSVVKGIKISLDSFTSLKPVLHKRFGNLLLFMAADKDLNVMAKSKSQSNSRFVWILQF